uniref:M20_dimer domain-containing protein n=1 Tax=Caenorhabditis tropicalis TaxID=1561998 RepID=A0A1I7UFE2_9PELO
MEHMDAVFKAIDEHQDEFIDLLRESVAIRSVSADPARRGDCIRMSEWTRDQLRNLGAETSLWDLGKQQLSSGEELPLPPAVFGVYGRDKSKKTLLIYGHLDVQPAEKEDGWNTDPFELTEINGKLFGRGSTDDKGPVIAWIAVLKILQRLGIDLPINIKFVLECMEESSSEGLDKGLEDNIDKISDITYSCISDNYWLGRNKPCLTYGLRGICYYFVEISCARQDLHSGINGGSVPEALNDLMWIMSQLVTVDGQILIPGIAELVAPVTKEEDDLYDKIDFCVDTFKNETGSHGLISDSKKDLLMNRWRYPSLSLHGVEGAFSQPGAKTVIPAKVTGKFSLRIVPHMTPEATDKLVTSYLESLWAKRKSPNTFKITSGHGGMPWVADFRDANFSAGSKAIERVYGMTPDFTREGGSIPVTLTIQDLTKSPVMLLPIGASDDMAHSQNEKINRENFVKGMKVLAAYLFELAA